MRTNNATQRAQIQAAIDAVRNSGNESLATQLEKDLSAIDKQLEKGKLSSYIDGIMDRVSQVNPMRLIAAASIGVPAGVAGFSFVTGVPFDVPNPYDTMVNAHHAAQISGQFGWQHAALDYGLGAAASLGELAVAGALFWVAYLAGDNFVDHTFSKADKKAPAAS